MFEYPKARKEDISENHFGIDIQDPYRWMEDDNSEETKAFVEDQIAFTNKYLDGITGKDKIKERLIELYNYEKFAGFRVIKGKILYSHNSGLQNQNVWYIQDGLDGEPEVLIDANTLSDDGTVAVSLAAASKDGRYISCLIAESGSDWNTIKILDLENKELLEDEINWVKFTGTAWEGDGFYYSAYDKPEDGSELSGVNANMKVYYHKLGDKQAEDKLVFEDSDNPLRQYSFIISDDENSRLVYVSEGTYGSEILLFDEESNEYEKLFDGFHADRSYLGKYESRLFFTTDEDTPNRKVLTYDLNDKSWTDLVDEGEHSLEYARLTDSYLTLVYNVDVVTQAYVRNLETDEEIKLEFEEFGSIDQIAVSKELNGIMYSFNTAIKPRVLNFFDFVSKETTVFRQSELAFDTTDFVTERHFVDASDGAKIPLFITYKKGMEKNGNNPTKLYAYGGFSVSINLSFSPADMYLVDQGGIYVSANIRGGAEYGDKWHKEGMLLNKQRVFDDFIECSEWLIENNYTSCDKLAIEGGSNGGLLMGTVTNQRPDLYRVVFNNVGVLDMLRYHLFTIGWAWIPEYGNPEEEEHFKNVYAYSPLHNIEEKDYPSVMIATADHDDRVVPAHSFKYGATLQESNTSDNPILLRIDKDAGHGAGKSIMKSIDTAADKYAFMSNEMGLI